MGVRSNVPLVGRDAELERACAAPTAPGGRIVALAGAGGVGKTAELDELVQRMAPDAALLLGDGHGVEVGGPAARRPVGRARTVSPVELHAWAAPPRRHGAERVL